MNLLQFRFSGIKFFGFKFCPSLLGIVVTVICIPLFIKFGFWQYNKAEKKQALQTMFDSYLKAPAIYLPATIAKPEDWRYRKVKVMGEYVTEYQILLDNQIENEVAGYHVITPLLIKGTKQLILVDRGWIAASETHSILPKVQTPAGEQLVNGQLWLPSTKIYSLEAKQIGLADKVPWNALWQNMDMARYGNLVPFKVMPLVIRLDAKSNAGGFLRNWKRPAERITTHIGYAYQWFGFAVAAFMIFIVVSTKKNEITQS